MPGPNPKPTQLKKLTGSWRADLNKFEPKPMQGKFPAPEHFSDVEKDMWYQISDVLYRMGVLTEADQMALEQLVVSWKLYRDSVKLIRDRGTTIIIETKTGQNYEQVAPWVTQARNALSDLLKLQDRFGLNPSARTKLQAEKMQDDSEAFLQNLIQGK